MAADHLAEWVSAVSEAVSALVILATLPFAVWQLREARRAGSATVVTSFYALLAESDTARRTMGAHADRIRAVDTSEQLEALQASDRAVHDAVIKVANVYQYLGFLLAARMMDRAVQVEVLHEARAGYERFADVAARYIELEAIRRNQKGLYKRHIRTVAKALEDLPRALSREPNPS